MVYVGESNTHSTEHKLRLTMYAVVTVIVPAILLPPLSSAAVYMRSYVRVHLTSTYVGIDDWLSGFSCVLVLGHGAAQIAGAVKGVLGRDNEPTANWRGIYQAKLL